MTAGGWPRLWEDEKEGGDEGLDGHGRTRTVTHLSLVLGAALTFFQICVEAMAPSIPPP